MSLTEFLFGTKTRVTMGSMPFEGGVGFIQLDCSVHETHTDAAEITAHPVEDGSIVSDHIRKLPNTLEISGIVTDTPITYLASLFAKPPTFASDGFIPSLPGSGRADEAYTLMQLMMEKGVTMIVITSLRNYNNMAIESLVVTRDASTGQTLDCTISLKEVKKAKALSIELPIPENPADSAPTEEGNVPPAASTPAQGASSTSMLSDLVGSFFG